MSIATNTRATMSLADQAVEHASTEFARFIKDATVAPRGDTDVTVSSMLFRAPEASKLFAAFARTEREIRSMVLTDTEPLGEQVDMAMDAAGFDPRPYRALYIQRRN